MSLLAHGTTPGVTSIFSCNDLLRLFDGGESLSIVWSLGGDFSCEGLSCEIVSCDEDSSFRLGGSFDMDLFRGVDGGSGLES